MFTIGVGPIAGFEPPWGSNLVKSIPPAGSMRPLRADTQWRICCGPHYHVVRENVHDWGWTHRRVRTPLGVQPGEVDPTGRFDATSPGRYPVAHLLRAALPRSARECSRLGLDPPPGSNPPGGPTW